MPEEIEMPPHGFYFMVGDAKFHVGLEDGRVAVRCVDGGLSASGDRLFTHQPAGNKVVIETH